MKNGIHIDEHGTKRWYINGKLHRENGPAIEYADGDKVWYRNNRLYRIDGPAIELADGTKRWFLGGKEITIRPMTPERLQRIALLL